MRTWPFWLGLMCVLGCSRGFYREQADQETYTATGEHIVRPAEAIGRLQLEPPPTARFADPTNPDCPPQPPDDPVAALFMAYPGHLTGYSHWGKDGHTDRIELANWRSSLPLNDAGTLVLDQDKSVQLALLHSREYQTELETVYLSALALTLNRFDFTCRWFARSNKQYTRTGASSLPFESNVLNVSSEVGFARDLAAGGQLLVDFANSFVWEFTGRTHTVSGNLGFTLVQPLLRNFGRQVRLESLTQAERNVLYAVRTFARFRKQFWAQTAIQSGGYLDLLLLLQTTRNAQANLVSQQENVRLQEALFAGGKVSTVDVDQARQEYQQAQQGVAFAETALQNALDAFKLQLGLPPELPVELDDAPLKTFELTDPQLEAFQAKLTEFQKDRLRELRQPPTRVELQQHYTAFIGLLEELPRWAEAATADLRKWGTQLAQPPADDDANERQRLLDSQRGLTAQVEKAQQTARTLLEQARSTVGDLANRDAKVEWEALTQSAARAVGLVNTLASAQAQARINLITLPLIAVPEAVALDFAVEQRLDLATALAQVTDVWRRVAVTANALRSDLNLTVGGNLLTEPTARNPFDFANDFSRFTVGFAFDGPLNRQAERNVYRAALIVYQRARRAYLQQEDTIKQQVRRDLRQLRLEQINFAIARRRLVAAARQLEGARIQLLNQREAAGTANTLLILNALRAVLESRNALAASLIQYQQQRIQLLLDLEALQLDAQGVPVPASLEPPQRSETPSAAPPATP
jgi:outer membrane protein TolC